MRLLVTGMAGTVAPRLAEHASRAGHDVVAWRREAVSPEDPDACRAFIDDVDPGGIVHLAFGAEEWSGLLAEAARDRGIPFVYTSTAMVFASRPDGPYPITAERNAVDDYGRYKARCEDAVWAANPDAMVARLGYQVDLDGRGNNLLAHLDARAATGASVPASTRWIPALAFLDDTASALLGLLEEPEAGLHHLDGNAVTAWSHWQVVTALARRLGRDWRVSPTDDPDHDQRLADSHRIAGLDLRMDGWLT